MCIRASFGRVYLGAPRTFSISASIALTSSGPISCVYLSVTGLQLRGPHPLELGSACPHLHRHAFEEGERLQHRRFCVAIELALVLLGLLGRVLQDLALLGAQACPTSSC